MAQQQQKRSVNDGYVDHDESSYDSAEESSGSEGQSSASSSASYTSEETDMGSESFLGDSTTSLGGETFDLIHVVNQSSISLLMHRMSIQNKVSTKNTSEDTRDVEQAQNEVLQQLQMRRHTASVTLGGRAAVVQTRLPSQTSKQVDNKNIQEGQDGDDGGAGVADQEPNELLRKLLKEKLGFTGNLYPFEELRSRGFFDGVTAEDIAAYDMEITGAVRRSDFGAVMKCYERSTNPRILQCSNKFGESLVHMACRRGCTDIVRFMFRQAKVSVRLVCDNGRSPLHDACWTSAPNFDCIRLILEACPDLLLIKDNRGMPPLDYIPRDAWEEWCDFLIDAAEDGLLNPRELD